MQQKLLSQLDLIEGYGPPENAIIAEVLMKQFKIYKDIDVSALVNIPSLL